jgi:hypothetical protein
VAPCLAAINLKEARCLPVCVVKCCSCSSASSAASFCSRLWRLARVRESVFNQRTHCIVSVQNGHSLSASLQTRMLRVQAFGATGLTQARCKCQQTGLWHHGECKPGQLETGWVWVVLFPWSASRLKCLSSPAWLLPSCLSSPKQSKGALSNPWCNWRT